MTLLKALQQILKEEGKNGLHVDFIVQRLKLYPDAIIGLENDEEIKKKANYVLLRESKKKGSSIVKAKNPKTGKEKKGTYRFINRIDPDTLPRPQPVDKDKIITQSTQDAEPKKDRNNLFTGRGGEYSVLGELLFNGYNANVMAVDEGIDIYATKNNFIFFIQVKTTFLNDKKTVSFNIRKNAFKRTEPSQVRYILVIRCGNGELRYFTFKSDDIDRFIYQKLINGEQGKESLTISIRYEDDNRPYLYRDDKSEDISFYQNNFNL
jgi:hypothetical protein